MAWGNFSSGVNLMEWNYRPQNVSITNQIPAVPRIMFIFYPSLPARYIEAPDHMIDAYF